MTPRIRSSVQLLIVSSLVALIFTWALLSQSVQIRMLAARQGAIEEMVNDARFPTEQDISTPSKRSLTKLVEMWSKLNSSPLPSFPDGRCSDAVCSNFVADRGSSLRCAEATVAKLAPGESVTPKCRFQNGTSKPVYLLRSYPGSGNTWIRQVLERVTGICTGSIYCDRELWLSGMIGEGVNTSSVLVVKTHSIQTHGDATIFIIRSPIDAIVSHWKWYIVFRNIYREEDGSHVVNPPVKYFRNNSGWNMWVKGQIRNWIRFLEHRLYQSEGPLLIVTYEDMKSNISREVFQMLDFLRVKYITNEVLERLKGDIVAFKRPKRNDFDPYTSPQRELVRTHLNDFMESLHHETVIKIVKQYLSEI